MFRKKEGFTLIELLVVIAIIAILASIALISLAPAQRAGRDARRIADLRQVQSILQLYYNKCGYYPGPGAAPGTTCPDVNDATATNHVPAATPSWNETTGLADVLAETGIITSAAQLPNDPIASPSRGYSYARNADGTSYALAAQLETDNSVLRTDVDGGNVFGLNCDDPVYCVQF